MYYNILQVLYLFNYHLINILEFGIRYCNPKKNKWNKDFVDFDGHSNL